MGLAKKVVLLFLLIVVSSGFGKAAKGAVYKVGDSAGWTNIVGHVDYRTWASQKTFRVGDVIGTLLNYTTKESLIHCIIIYIINFNKYFWF